MWKHRSTTRGSAHNAAAATLLTDSVSVQRAALLCITQELLALFLR